MIENIFKKLRPEADINNSVDLVRDYMLDSFDIIKLIAEINKAYSINIRTEFMDINNFRTKESILNIINQHK